MINLQKLICKAKRKEIALCKQCNHFFKIEKVFMQDGAYYTGYCSKCDTIYQWKVGGLNGFKGTKASNKTK